MPIASTHLVRLSRIALIVAAVDLLSKALASSMLGGESRVVTDWVRLAIVHNDKGAFGISLGQYTRQLNLALTLSAIALMIPVSRDLARIDRAAPWALGLIVGGALGNLTSLITSPAGVVDFIAIQTSPASAFVLNVADVAAYSGLALLSRTGFRLVSRIRSEMRVAPDIEAAPIHLVRTEREVAIPLVHEGLADIARPRPAWVDGVRPIREDASSSQSQHGTEDEPRF